MVFEPVLPAESGHSPTAAPAPTFAAGDGDVTGPWSLLASAVSDDLRASLSLVGGYSQTLLHLPLDEEARDHHVAGLLAATGAVAQAAQEVLDLVLATAGRPGLHRRPVTADWLLDRLGRTGTNEPDGGIEWRADSGLPLVEVDPAWITHALRILVMHAQRISGAPRVMVHAHGNASSVVLTVRSIPTTPDVSRRRQAVGVFPRPVAARSEGGDAHLGLCRQIVEANGGNLRVDETPERCFATISLPAMHAEVPAPR
jgi:K+-sensing histidine kinase KdpD